MKILEEPSRNLFNVIVLCIILLIIVLLCSCKAQHPAIAFNKNAAYGRVYQQKVHTTNHYHDKSGGCPRKFRIIL